MKTTNKHAGNKSGNMSSGKMDYQPHPFLKKTAEILQHRATKMPLHTKWLGLIGFCLLSVGCSLGVIVYSVQTAHPFFSVEPIHLPVPVSKPHLLPGLKDSAITAAQYRRVQAIESFLLNHKDHPSTKAFSDSLLKVRPDFLDSLRTIDSLFLSR